VRRLNREQVTSETGRPPVDTGAEVRSSGDELERVNRPSLRDVGADYRRCMRKQHGG
jgi:hypothetical protein